MTTPNNSSVAGYLLPSGPQVYPGNLTLKQFIQTALVGLTGFDGTLIRPKFQLTAPKEPTQLTDWVAFDILDGDSDVNSSNTLQPDGSYILQRQEELEIQCAVYGPQAFDTCNLIKNGLQLTQNLAALKAGNIGFIKTTKSTHAPELVGELWNDRYDFSIWLTRQFQLTYPVLSFLSASGTITTIVGTETYLLPWDVNNE